MQSACAKQQKVPATLPAVPCHATPSPRQRARQRQLRRAPSANACLPPLLRKHAARQRQRHAIMPVKRVWQNGGEIRRKTKFTRPCALYMRGSFLHYVITCQQKGREKGTRQSIEEGLGERGGGGGMGITGIVRVVVEGWEAC